LGLKLKFDLIGKVLNIGLPVFGEQLIMRLGHLFYERMGASLGTAAYAADQVALKAEAFSYMPGFGLAVATATVVGKNLGAGQRCCALSLLLSSLWPPISSIPGG